jgi:hypothetical protein
MARLCLQDKDGLKSAIILDRWSTDIRCCNAMARIELSQPAFSASRLSASMYARIWSGLRLSKQIVETLVVPTEELP